ncbi:hypothetical protein SAMN02745119_03299 [Trichlorobacter thiogenes]|uniref:Uncharacterized protein n=2 Tax=Trichlorobacter thiogenes TaxID=115783 RepID=A0A1T4S7A3_9BACT|nr:hypothetical protein SAMN02745119_03299 [Trichlorobacter thiogenes]
MRRVVSISCMLLFTVVSAFSAGPDKAGFEHWCMTVNLPGYTYGGVKESDPGIYTSAWINTQQVIVGLQLHPLSSYPDFMQAVKFKMPVSFTYNGLPAVYTDALQVGQAAIKFEKSDMVLMITQIDQSGQTKPRTKEELSALLDQMKPEQILQ